MRELRVAVAFYDLQHEHEEEELRRARVESEDAPSPDPAKDYTLRKAADGWMDVVE